MIKFKNEGIYCIYNVITKDMYIGSSLNLGQRKTKHFSLLNNNKHTNYKLQNDFIKYGKDNFQFNILKYCIENLEIEEEKFVKRLKPKYNLIVEIVNKKMSEESKLKMSETKKELFRNGKLKPNCSKRIIQIDLEGTILNAFESIRQASIQLNIDRSAIQRVLYGKYQQMKGFRFLYETDLVKSI